MRSVVRVYPGPPEYDGNTLMALAVFRNVFGAVCFKNRGPVAQLVEHQPCKLGVQSSNLCRSTTISSFPDFFPSAQNFSHSAQSFSSVGNSTCLFLILKCSVSDDTRLMPCVGGSGYGRLTVQVAFSADILYQDSFSL